MAAWSECPASWCTGSRSGRADRPEAEQQAPGTSTCWQRPEPMQLWQVDVVGGVCSLRVGEVGPPGRRPGLADLAADCLYGRWDPATRPIVGGGERALMPVWPAGATTGRRCSSRLVLGRYVDRMMPVTLLDLKVARDEEETRMPVTTEASAHAAGIRPFTVETPEAELEALRGRIAATRWPNRELVDDRSQGVQSATIQQARRLLGIGLRLAQTARRS